MPFPFACISDEMTMLGYLLVFMRSVNIEGEHATLMVKIISNANREIFCIVITPELNAICNRQFSRVAMLDARPQAALVAGSR
jgi:hypothetical protein